jgi:exosortase K
MQTNKNLGYYLTTIGLFFLLKLAYRFADNDNLVFLLKPTDKIVGVLTGTHAVYFSDQGYYHDSLTILIEKSCSGFNFLLICFCMLAFLFLKYADNTIFRSISIPLALLIAYLLTIFVNAFRIFVSIVMQQQVNTFLPEWPHATLHEIVGVVTSLSFLILIYMVSEKVLTNKYQNAKLTES